MPKTRTTTMPSVRRPLRREPTHPGEILREDVWPALRMNVSQAARELGQPAFDVWHAEQALRVGLRRIPGHAA
ncbi:MAG: hypothetical protein KJ066_22490 [Acidobacteria bacterium]|nr:hypothetical protein [Acidobacteriota bacterium]